MKILKPILLFIFSSLIIGEVSADANLTKRMKARLPDVMEAKLNGFIGESVDGLLLVRDKKVNSKVEKLVQAENEDRNSLFKLLAKDTGGDTKLVAKKFAKGIASRAKKGHWFKNSSGNWITK
jgi:uncharacterized protein YdbL (DUF1318 family)